MNRIKNFCILLIISVFMLCIVYEMHRIQNFARFDGISGYIRLSNSTLYKKQEYHKVAPSFPSTTVIPINKRSFEPFSINGKEKEVVVFSTSISSVTESVFQENSHPNLVNLSNKSVVSDDVDDVTVHSDDVKIGEVSDVDEKREEEVISEQNDEMNDEVNETTSEQNIEETTTLPISSHPIRKSYRGPVMRVYKKPASFRKSFRSPRSSKDAKHKLYYNTFQQEKASHLNLVFNATVYPRGEINHTPRDPYNDILQNIRNKRHMASSKEGYFKQTYSLLFYKGSTFISTNGFNETVKNETDFTIISQTSIERLFFFPMLLKRWPGDFCITIFLTEEDATSIQSSIEQANYPSRLHLILYIVNPSLNKDCVYRKQGKDLICRKEKIYPLNRLRNLAIQNIRTTHFIVFDMDMWPAKHLYNSLQDLPPSYLSNPYVVTIIPAFSLPDSVIKSPKCVDLPSCVHLAVKSYPETKKSLVHCLQFDHCTIFRPKSFTHDYLPKKWATLPPSTKVTKVKCFRQRFLEPYVMVRKTPNLPLFDERFINYGFNKVEWIENLRYLGYEYHVLSQAYAIDIPHSISSFAKKYNEGFSDKSLPMLALYRRFLTDMRATHSDESRQLLCLRPNIDLKEYRE